MRIVGGFGDIDLEGVSVAERAYCDCLKYQVMVGYPNLLFIALCKIHATSEACSTRIQVHDKNDDSQICHEIAGKHALCKKFSRHRLLPGRTSGEHRKDRKIPKV